MKANKYIIIFIAIFSVLLVFPAHCETVPPEWAPANGYRAKTRHIYFPEYNTYFDLKKDVYIYEKDGVWFIVKSVPAKLKLENLKTSPQVQLYLDTDLPFTENEAHKSKYNYLARHDENSQLEINKSLKRQQREIKKIKKGLNK